MSGFARMLAEARRAASRSPHAVSAGHKLTPAQVDVLRLLASGRSTTEIANDTGRSRETIRTHAKRVYAKLGVRNRNQALERARLFGLL